MEGKRRLIKCPNCGKVVENGFSDPYDWANNISMFYSKRIDSEYDFSCPECKCIYIFPSEPKNLMVSDD